MMDKISIKSCLIKLIITQIEEKISHYNNEMKKAQEEANYHIGAMQSRYDTFKEEAQMLKDGFARQLNIASDISNKIHMYYELFNKNKKIDSYVKTGSIINVLANNEREENYFIFFNMSMSSFDLEEKKYIVISPDAPISKEFFNKEIGDEINFRGKNMEILNVF